MAIVMGLFMATTFMWKQPTSPLLAKLICIPILFFFAELVKDGIKHFSSKRTPQAPTLPRKVRRDMERSAIRINKVIRRQVAQNQRKRFRTMLRDAEQEMGRPLNTLEVKELIDYLNCESPRTATAHADMIG